LGISELKALMIAPSIKAMEYRCAGCLLLFPRRDRYVYRNAPSTALKAG
jgi:hypothetical protein